MRAGPESDRVLTPWTPTTAMFDMVRAVFGILLSDMMKFLREASEQISRTVSTLTIDY